MVDWDEHSDRVYGSRPQWVRGHISHLDARFLFRQVVHARAPLVIEIGTASGLSTAVLAHAASHVAPENGFAVETYDVNPRFYLEPERRSGDAAREMLREDLLSRVSFHAPGNALTAADRHSANSVPFAFIDGSHQHPWTALDVLALLPVLQAGATVVMHDINLPSLGLGDADWGAKHLFDAVDVSKQVDARDVPNIGSFVVPDDKAALSDQVRGLIDAHGWETEVDPAVVDRVLAPASGP